MFDFSWVQSDSFIPITGGPESFCDYFKKVPLLVKRVVMYFRFVDSSAKPWLREIYVFWHVEPNSEVYFIHYFSQNHLEQFLSLRI